MNKKQRLHNLSKKIQNHNLSTYPQYMKTTDFYNLKGWVLKDHCGSKTPLSKENTILNYTKDNLSVSIDYNDKSNCSAKNKNRSLTIKFSEDHDSFALLDDSKNVLETIKKISCKHPSPNVYAFGNVDADVMIVMQDWSCFENLTGINKKNNPVKQEDIEEGFGINTQANINLFYILLKCFFEPNIDNELLTNSKNQVDLYNPQNKETIVSQIKKHKVYITNVFKFIKPGKMSKSISSKLLMETKKFIKEEINTVKPKLLICVGKKAAQAIYKSLELESGVKKKMSKSSLSMKDYHLNHQTHNNTLVYCQHHTSPQSYNKNKDKIKQWNSMFAHIK
ncbi:MAG: hypothetical protein CMK59_05820 [Proteobacteria bacterium]|nr:hypothetical protein [Pseudomonadota bacterium]